MGKEKRKSYFCSSFVSPFYLHLRGSHHLVRSMAKEEEIPTAVDVEIVKKSFLPLQDPWYCSSPLFPMVPTDISASDVPSFYLHQCNFGVPVDCSMAGPIGMIGKLKMKDFVKLFVMLTFLKRF